MNKEIKIKTKIKQSKIKKQGELEKIGPNATNAVEKVQKKAAQKIKRIRKS